jgi:ABC-type nickel/cobalt efflux system permease component RcnA
MPRLIALSVLAVVAGLAVVWWTGGMRMIEVWALDGQRTAQDAMARGLRALRAGEPAALAGFLTVCFGYGFFHAAGPGHGKLLIGGYGAARAVGAVRLSAVALVSSLAQGLTAVALVAAGVWIWQIGRERMTDMADRLFAPLSFAAIALVGLWLVWRGARRLIALAREGRAAAHPAPDVHHDHDHHHDHHCATCGHAHAPDPAALARATGWRERAMLVGAVAIRPCTGALFVLIVTAQMGIFAIGIAGTFAMALGTASVTVAVAVAAVTLRRGVLAGFAESATLARAQPILEVAVGAVIAIVATQLTLAAL